MSTNSSAKYYQKKTKKGFKKIAKGIRIFLKKKKIKSGNMVADDIKISQKMKNKGYLSIEKILQDMEK